MKKMLKKLSEDDELAEKIILGFIPIGFFVTRIIFEITK